MNETETQTAAGMLTLNENESLNLTNETDFIATTPANIEKINPSMIAAVFMLSVFFVVGTIGNALAFIIYYRKREKGTSTIFIISLTVTDFLTCLIAIPWTITHELMEYKYALDIFCKLYVFLITFNTPLSSLILVFIGFDRYFCICHPFLHVITVPRAKIIVFVLTVVAMLLGVVPFLSHSIYYVDTKTVNITVPIDVVSSIILTNQSSPDTDFSSSLSTILPVTTPAAADFLTETTSLPESSTSGQIFTEGLFLNPDTNFLNEMQHNTAGTIPYKTGHPSSSSSFSSISPSSINYTIETVNRSAIIHYGTCVISAILISHSIFTVYQLAYASLFLLEFIVIIILYALIFRSIILRRAWRAKRRQKSSYSAPSCVEAEETQLTNVNGNSAEVAVVKKNSGRISAAMRDRTLYANIRTAAMLFVVTIVFVVSFLPSWLTGLRVIRLNLIAFYTFYFNNVANPIIYAFMNRTFRDELVLLIRNCVCRR